MKHVFADVFQRPGTMDWTWRTGESDHYWGYCFRPRQANEPGVEIVRQFTSTDNNVRSTEHFTVTVRSGNLYRLSAIAVIG